MGPAPDWRGRVGGAALAIALHAALAAMLALFATRPPTTVADDALRAFDVPPPAPSPPPPIEPAPAPAPEPAGAAAPAAPRAVPAPIVAPPPVVPLPFPVIAAPVAGRGVEASAGAAALGTGTGAGGVGTGLGSGAGGSGTGGAGSGTRAKLVLGAIRDRDYPATARRAGAMGTATVAFTVGADGRARGCRTIVSAGDAALDATTCRLIEQRFRYAPATDAAGKPIAEDRGWRQRWWFAAKD